MLDLKQVEEEMLKFWEKNKIYEKSVKKNKKGKKFYFLQGPPYTSGRLHIGHAWNNSLKDIAMRYFRMKGFDVWDRAGYDMHGLPTENKVQKELKLEDKQDIVKYGMEKFIRACEKFSVENMKLMNTDLRRLGIWMDFDNAYMPISNDFISGEWMLMKRAYEQKRLYKGKKIMHWCGECETSLAKHELEYETVKDNSIFLKFKLKDRKDEYLIVFTTTPWTIPFNLAVMVNPELDYVKAEVETGKGKKEKWVIAAPLAGIFISGLLELKYKILDTFKGEKLEGKEYEHPFYNELKEVYDKLKKSSKNVHTVILSREYVSAGMGSGLVHCAPGCGPEDYEVGKEYGIPAFNTLNEKGELENAGKFSGWVAKKDDKKFVAELEKLGNLIIQTPVEHEYAHCWRCHSPVVFRATEQWFMKIEDLVPKILEYDKKIKWVPEIAKKNYESWITNLRDNGVTRQRFWGCPMPLWECECGGLEVIGSEEELKKKAVNKIPSNLHKPWIDDVKLRCPKCKKQISRAPDVIDVWIDSGTASWNCLYYPQTEKYFKKYFPADLILEATEQTSLWFSMLQICSTIMFNKQCYTGAHNHGMILDFQGMKMSKSLGNIISPYEVIDKYSSEVLRYYICEIRAGENANFNWEDVKQKQRNLFVLMNTGNYLTQLKTEKENKKYGIEEKYILSRVSSTIQKVSELFESYNFDRTITEIENLFLDISRVYIKMTRDKSLDEKALVYTTLKNSFVDCLKMFACVCPLISESIWQELRKNGIVKEESVHLCEWPKADKKMIDVKLEQEFEVVMKIIEAGLAERDKIKIGLKWPLAKAEVKVNGILSDEMIEIIKNQLQVKEVEVVNFKENNELMVKFDTEITDELEAEGYARNISRAVQALRKKAGLVKEDKIDLILIVDTQLNLLLEFQKEFLKSRINAKKLEVASKDSKPKGFVHDKFAVKNKEIKIYLKKV